MALSDGTDEGSTPAARSRLTATRDASSDRRARSASSSIYRALRDDILCMRRRPGEPIVEKQIAQIYGVSRTPVREAMLKLADEGLVDIYPQSGTFVARIPLDALPEAMEIRQALEVAAVRLAAGRATEAQIAAMRDCLDRQVDAIARDDRDVFHETDECFHRTVAIASGFPRFWDVIQQVKIQVDRYRRLTLPEPGRMSGALAEHKAVVDAIAQRDPEQATAAMSAHLSMLRVSLDVTREISPYYFSSQGEVGGEGA